MAQLDNTQLEILQNYKQDLRRGNISKLAKDLVTRISKWDRGEIISYLLEHNIDILSAMNFIPELGIVEISKLPVLTIPGNIEIIRKNAIVNNPSLKEILIEDGVRVLEPKAIHSNSALETIILPSSIKTLGTEAFANNSSLKEVFIPDSVTVLPKGLFNGCDDGIVIKANFRENKSDRLKCVEGEKDWYKSHLKWIKD